MTSEDLNHHHLHHQHLMMDNPGVFCLATCNQPTNQRPPFHFHVEEPRSHGNQTKDETDSLLLREIGQQLAGIGDEVNSRYSINRNNSNNNIINNNNINSNNNNNNSNNNNSADEAHFSITFNVTFHLLPYFRVAMEMITRRQTTTSNNSNANATTTTSTTTTNNNNHNHYNSSHR